MTPTPTDHGEPVTSQRLRELRTSERLIEGLIEEFEYSVLGRTAGSGTRERLEAARLALVAREQELQAEIDRLRNLINNPHTEDWVRAVRLEAAHQQERWGTEHDAGKGPADWFWLLGHLSSKALLAFLAGDCAKGRHHIVSSAACLLNWHRHEARQPTALMRPGIDPPKG